VVAFKKAVGLRKERQRLFRRLPREVVPQNETPSLQNSGRSFEAVLKFLIVAASIKGGLQAVVSETSLLQATSHGLRAFRYVLRKLSGRGPGGMILLPRGDDTPFTPSCKLEQYRTKCGGGEKLHCCFHIRHGPMS